MTEGQSLRARRSEETRKLILGVARERFGARGYAHTPIEEILKATGLTKGALYHHFADKQALFRAVLDATAHDLFERVRTLSRPEKGRGPWTRLETAAVAFLDACLEPAVRQIVLVDGPAVVGWEEARRIEATHGIHYVRRLIGDAVETSILDDRPVDLLAHAIFAAVREVALVTAHAPDPAASRVEATGMLRWLLDRLRRDPAG